MSENPGVKLTFELSLLLLPFMEQNPMKYGNVLSILIKIKSYLQQIKVNHQTVHKYVEISLYNEIDVLDRK